MMLFPQYKKDTILAGILILALVLHFINIFDWYDSSFLIGVVILGLLPVFWSAFQSIKKREWASMDTLASVALIFSLLSGEWVSAVFIELMLTAARILSDVTRDRTEKSIRGLLKFRPQVAFRELNGILVSTPIKEIKVGDIVVVDIGQRIPVDGIVISGTGSVNESSLTGESLPVDKMKESVVMSSTLLESGNLRIQTTHTGADTTFERVIHLVESARSEKPQFQTLGEKFGKLYLISIFVGSALLLIFTQNILLVLSVVLVVCADDVAIAIPIAYLRAIHSAAAHGIIIKGASYLENLGKVKTIIFDKTGTLTTGTLKVSEIIACEKYTTDEVLDAAVLTARRSTHPVSRAILTFADTKNSKVIYPDSVEEKAGKGIVVIKDDIKYIFGKKVLCEEYGVIFSDELLRQTQTKFEEGKSISYVARENNLIGFICTADEVKFNAEAVIQQLRALGIEKMVMLTGDNDIVAKNIANTLHLDEWHANLLPEDKVNIIRKFQKNSSVAMVGDGVNDAAALSLAGVGIAMGGLGSEGTIESAQIVLMRDDLAALPIVIQLARMTRRVSFQDFWIWGVSNVLGLLLVFVGYIGPSGAAAYNFLSDFFPLFNSVRVRVKK